MNRNGSQTTGHNHAETLVQGTKPVAEDVAEATEI